MKQYRLPCDGTDPDYLYNQVCQERDQQAAEIERLRAALEVLDYGIGLVSNDRLKETIRDAVEYIDGIGDVVKWKGQDNESD